MRELINKTDNKDMPFMNEETYHRFLDAFLPSLETREYLKREPMLPGQSMLDLIKGAPVSLEEKARWAWGEYKSEVEAALSDLTLHPGEIFTLTAAWYDNDIREQKAGFDAPYLSFISVIAHIREELEESGDEYSDLQWYVLEKWVPCNDRDLKRTYRYWLVKDQVMYFCDECRQDSFFADPNLPVPFHVGDLLTIDCRPFAPVKHALLLERGDNCDCCCLQALCLNEKTGLWIIGAVKHRSLFGQYPLYTPIYRLSRFAGELSPEEQPLLSVQKAIGEEESKGRKIWDRYQKYSSYPQGLTDKQLCRLVKSLKQEKENHY